MPDDFLIQQPNGYWARLAATDVGNGVLVPVINGPGVSIRDWGVYGTRWDLIAAGVIPDDEGARIQAAIDETTAKGLTLEFESVCYGSARSLIIPYAPGTSNFTTGPNTRWLGKPGTMIRALPGVDLEYFIAGYNWVNNIAGTNGAVAICNMMFDGSPTGRGPYEASPDVTTKRVFVNNSSLTSLFFNILVQNSLQSGWLNPEFCLNGVTSAGASGGGSDYYNIHAKQCVEDCFRSEAANDMRMTSGRFFRARHPVVLLNTNGMQWTQTHTFSGAPYTVPADLYVSYVDMDSTATFHGNVWEGNNGAGPIRYFVKGVPAKISNETWMVDGDVQVEFQNTVGLMQFIGCRGAMTGQIANLSTSSDCYVVDVGGVYFRTDPYAPSAGSYRAIGASTLTGGVQVLDGIQNTPNKSYLDIGGVQGISAFPYTIPDDMSISDFVVTAGLTGGTDDIILPANIPRDRRISIKRIDAMAGEVRVLDALGNFVTLLTVSSQIVRIIQQFTGTWRLMDHTDDYAFPRRVGLYTIATLPPAADYRDCISMVTNAAAPHSQLVYSTGLNWRYVDDNALV